MTIEQVEYILSLMTEDLTIDIFLQNNDVSVIDSKYECVIYKSFYKRGERYAFKCFKDDTNCILVSFTEIFNDTGDITWEWYFDMLNQFHREYKIDQFLS